MNKRKFLKALGSLPLLGSVVSLGKDKYIHNVHINESIPLPPIEKAIEFDKSGLHYKVMITDQILIQLPDKSYELNVYGQWCKIIAKVNKEGDRKVTRYESEVFDKKDVLAAWNGEVTKIISHMEMAFEV